MSMLAVAGHALKQVLTVSAGRDEEGMPGCLGAAV